MLIVKQDKTRKEEEGQIFVELTIYRDVRNIADCNRLGYWCDKAHLSHFIMECAKCFTQDELKNILKMNGNNIYIEKNNLLDAYKKGNADNKKMLKADIILVSDTSMISMQIPSITCGLRGLTYMEVEVTGPNKDLHSGLFGGAVANPANVLARMVASLIDENGHVTIPGFYDDVRELTAAERKAFNKAPFNLTEYKKTLEIGDVEGEAGFTTIERTGIRPSLDVNGIWGGYIEEGTKTVIPSKASAKISMRLVPGQDFKKIAKLFEKHFKAIAPKSVKVKVKFLHGGMPYVAPTDMPAYKAAEKAIADTFGKKPLPFYSGGSIPIISGFENILGIKSLLIGFGLAEDAIHSPNESYGLDQFYKGVETIPLFYKYFAEK
mgnify:CR=1 FL=1